MDTRARNNMYVNLSHAWLCCRGLHTILYSKNSGITGVSASTNPILYFHQRSNMMKVTIACERLLTKELDMVWPRGGPRIEVPAPANKCI